MDRIQIKCHLESKERNLQLDKKAMPGEVGPCFMVSEDGCFKGYIARQRNGTYKPIGPPHYTAQDLMIIGESLKAKI